MPDIGWFHFPILVAHDLAMDFTAAIIMQLIGRATELTTVAMRIIRSLRMRSPHPIPDDALVVPELPIQRYW